MKDAKYFDNLYYPIVLNQFYDDGELVFSAEIKELPGLKVYGDSYSDVLNEIALAKTSWIEFNMELGRDIPEPIEEINYSGRVTLRIPKSLHRELKARADAESVSLNSFLNYILSEGLRKEDILSLKGKIFTELKQLSRNILSNIYSVSDSTKNILSNIDYNRQKDRNEYHIYFNMQDEFIKTKTSYYRNGFEKKSDDNEILSANSEISKEFLFNSKLVEQ